MPRVRVRKTSRGQIDLSKYKDAYEEVKTGGSLRKSAEKHGLNHCSLLRYIRKRDVSGEQENPDMGYKAHNRVFNEVQERELSKYLIRCADIYFGLPKKEVRKLAYELVVKYNLSRPKTWDDNELAGEEWYRMFMRRNPELSLRAAQATSLSRATSFNKTNVDSFYDNLATVMDRHKFEPQDIYNADETGITTVQKPDRVVARRGAHQVGSVTLAERGKLVTVAFAANAIGNVIPPFFVFPTVRYQEHFIRDGPPGSAGAANPSGWMQDETFMHFLEHFKKHTNVSLSHKVLLLLDNHYSHVHINALDFCKNNGIILLSFPPHCSHRLQPLDRSAYGSLKKAVNSACDAWMRNHPGRTMSIYDIPGIVASAMPVALTASNIQAGFRKTGTYPYNRNLFTELDFAPAFVTDRPNPENTTEPAVVPVPNTTLPVEPVFVTDVPNQENAAEVAIVPVSVTNPPEDETPPLSPSLLNYEQPADMVAQPGAINSSLVPIIENQETATTPPRHHSSINIQETSPKPSTSAQTISSIVPAVFSPEIIRPFPKAAPRKNNNKGRKIRKSTIYTDTPEKEEIRKEHEIRLKRTRAKQVKKQLDGGKKKQLNRGKKKQLDGGKNKRNTIKGKQKNIQEEVSSEDEECFCLVCMSSYSNSRPGEQWIQCISCKLWAHEECTESGLSYISQNCDSD
ncbi:uncharacterized protein LOC118268371 [Spodoptera frugiperda]|uniref:Uncharacterized protein LOC118268371 n=1 Tax=Spodoptera frugiperda TaxID=7108 RepID=A0A9R0DMQ0_SPOFR|nr:uncharacterized protein LOC118268371 [Spodoptera frugiperda]